MTEDQTDTQAEASLASTSEALRLPEGEALLPLTQAIFWSGISADCLQRYEKDGLIHPKRSERGIRLYSQKDLLSAQQIFNSRAARRGLTSIRRNLKPAP